MISNYYPPYHIGGACIHVYQLANALAENGYKVHIIYSLDWFILKKGNIIPKDDFPNHKNIFLYPIKSPLNILTPLLAYTFGYYYPLSEKILRLIKNINPDIIHHHNITGFGPFILNAKAEKVIYTSHDYWLVCPTYTLFKNNKKSCINHKNCSICLLFSKKPPQIWRYLINTKMLIKNIDEIISPSNFMKKKLNDFGINKKINVIPHFTVPVNSYNENEKTIYRDPYLLFVGRLETYKGILNLISEFKISKSSNYLNLIIVGTGSLSKLIEKECKSDKNNIKYLGYVNNSLLYDLYKNAISVIIPSIWDEPFGLTAIESICQETPIIASKKGALDEIIMNSKAGIQFMINNKYSLSIAIDEIFFNTTLRNKLKLNAKKNKIIFSKEEYIKKYLHLLGDE